jgi:hypothetical protein
LASKVSLRNGAFTLIIGSLNRCRPVMFEIAVK